MGLARRLTVDFLEELILRKLFIGNGLRSLLWLPWIFLVTPWDRSVYGREATNEAHPKP